MSAIPSMAKLPKNVAWQTLVNPPIERFASKSVPLFQQSAMELVTSDLRIADLGIAKGVIQARKLLDSCNIATIAQGLTQGATIGNIANDAIASLGEAIAASKFDATPFTIGAITQDLVAEVAVRHRAGLAPSDLTSWRDLSSMGVAVKALTDVRTNFFGSLAVAEKAAFPTPFIHVPERKYPDHAPLPLHDFDDERTDVGLYVPKQGRGRPFGSTYVSEEEFISAAEQYVAIHGTIPSQPQMQDAIHQSLCIWVSVDSVKRYAVRVFGSWKNFRRYCGRRWG